MTGATHDLRLGIAMENEIHMIAELVAAFRAAADDLGIANHPVVDARSEAAADVVVAIGQLKLYPDLVARPRAARRIDWYTEPLPDGPAHGSRRIHRALPTGRILDMAMRVAPRLARSGHVATWREDAAVERDLVANLAEVRRAARLFDEVVMDTYVRLPGMAYAGLGARVVPFGYHASMAGPLTDPGMDRDLDVLALTFARSAADRRNRLVESMPEAFAGRGISFQSLKKRVYGAERQALLARTRIAIEPHRIPGNHPGVRYIMATAAGAAVATEPLSDARPLVPGVHYLEADTDRLIDTVAELLGDEPRRRALVSAGQELLQGELDMRTSVRRLLAGPASAMPRSTIRA